MDKITYLAAAYIIIWGAVFVYLGILGSKLNKIGKDLQILKKELEERKTPLD